MRSETTEQKEVGWGVGPAAQGCPSSGVSVATGQNRPSLPQVKERIPIKSPIPLNQHSVEDLVHQNHLKGWEKTQISGPRLSGSECLGWGPSLCIADKSLGGADTVSWPTPL